MKKDNNDEVLEIDLLRLIKVLWHRAWIVAIAAFVAAGVALCYAKFAITPLYRATSMMYVNNSSFSVGGMSYTISSAQLTAAQGLVDTYLVILNSRTTLNEVADKSGLNYSYAQLSQMISASAVNETEIFKVAVTSSNPEHAKIIANTIAEVLPKSISNVVDGSDVRVVDYAVTPTKRVSPSYTKYTMVGFAIGAVLSAGLIVLLDIFDDVIHDSDYLHQTYSDIPVLAMIPNLAQSSSDSSYGYKYGYGYGYGKSKNSGDKKGA